MTHYVCGPRSRISLDGVDITDSVAELNDASPGMYFVKVYPEGDDVSYEDAYYVEGDIEIVWAPQWKRKYKNDRESGRAILPQVPVV